MFITPFPIIFLQLKVSSWHLFPWQRHPYFTLLPSTVNLSGYENSSCVFFSPHLATLVFSGWPLKPSSWGSFTEQLKWKEWSMFCFSFLLFSSDSHQTPSLILTNMRLKWLQTSWTNCLLDFCGIKTGRRRKPQTDEAWKVLIIYKVFKIQFQQRSST